MMINEFQATIIAITVAWSCFVIGYYLGKRKVLKDEKFNRFY